MKFRLYLLADEISHRLHLPAWIICDRFERYINPLDRRHPVIPATRRTRPEHGRRLADQRIPASMGMSAKTFDLDDPAQYRDYLEHATLQSALYGGLYLTFDGSHVTVHDASEVQIRTSDVR